MSEPKTKEDARSRIAAAERIAAASRKAEKKDRLAMASFRADMHAANAQRFEVRAAELRELLTTLPE